jgi:hypothetical protein
LSELDAWKWDERVQLVLELINRGRKDQAAARARKLQEEKQRQKRMELAQKALFAMIQELGSDFGPVLSSTLAYFAHLHAHLRAATAAATLPRHGRQDPDFGEPGPSTRLIGYSREEVDVLSQAARAIAELFRQGYTIQHIELALFWPG